MKSGFFVPKTISSDYVSSKRTAGGSNVWDQTTQEANLQKQQALQIVGKQHSTTINQAYSSYLMASHGVQGSEMGEGYKNAYLEVMRNQLVGQIEETNMNAANLRAEIGQQTNQMKMGIQEMYEAEIANMDRGFGLANQYLSYLAKLTTEDMKGTYLSEEQITKFNKGELNIDDMYSDVFNAQPRNYIDDKGELSLSYAEWVNKQLKGTEADNSWYKWFQQSGLGQMKEAAKKGVKK